MSYKAPEIPIQVDTETGVWQTDGLPMLYVPRHFFNNLHLEIEQSLGREAYAKSLFNSGYKSAYFWCNQESKTHNLRGVDCFEHYLKRLSQRGWGQFSFVEKDILNTQSAVIRVDNSSFVLHQQAFSITPHADGVCYQFSGWFAGATEWVLDQHESVDTDAKAAQNNVNTVFTTKETRCAAHNGDYCLFTVSR